MFNCSCTLIMNLFSTVLNCGFISLNESLREDMFLFSSNYQDVATLSCLPRYTGGQTFYYPGWNASRSEDAMKFANEFSKFLSVEIALEAVMRIRATAGMLFTPIITNGRSPNGVILRQFFQSFIRSLRFPSIP